MEPHNRTQRANNCSRAEVDHSKLRLPSMQFAFMSQSEPILTRTPPTSSNNGNIVTNEQNKDNLDNIEYHQYQFTNFSQFPFDFDPLQNNKTEISNLSEDLRRFSFEIEPAADDGNDDDDRDSDDSETEPSPTPVISDLDDLPIPKNVLMAKNKSIPIDINAFKKSSLSSLPNHGKSIPTMESDDDEDDDDDNISEISITPEPEQFDSPHCQFQIDTINVNYNDVDIKFESDFNDEESNVDVEFRSDSDDLFLPTLPSNRPTLGGSKSWQEITMTRIRNKESKRIKCITPISQEMAEMKINFSQQRRRSVANITDSIHRLFKLDPDLLRIRDEYLKKQHQSENSDNDDDNKEIEDELNLNKDF